MTVDRKHAFQVNARTHSNPITGVQSYLLALSQHMLDGGARHIGTLRQKKDEKCRVHLL